MSPGKLSFFLVFWGFLLGGSISPIRAATHFIGEPKARKNMTFRALYLQPTSWAPIVPRGKNTSKTWLWWPAQGSEERPDIHLEARVRSTEDNPYGFKKGAWIPYLTIQFVLRKKASDWVKKGYLMAMVASNGPHYGDNVSLNGPGKYKLAYRIFSPAQNGLLRHTDRETKVIAWWESFTIEWDFFYVGVGKKGEY